MVQKRLKRVTAWVFVMLVAINFMYCGFGHETFKGAAVAGPLSVAQMESLGRLYTAADLFIGDDAQAMPGRDWAELLQSRRLGYDGEVVAKAVDLTVEQVLPALPPEDIGGSVNALEVAEADMRKLLANPDLSVKPRDEWPEKLSKARMRISDSEWAILGPELVRRGLCKTLKAAELIMHNGKALLSGAFGVGKGKWITSAKTGKLVEVLRLIINLVPSNELQIPITGDVDTLPHFGQWLGLELLRDELLVWSSEDISCAFYVFGLPNAWLPWFALGKPLPGTMVGHSDDELRYLAVSVVPMGWLSAVGVCQAFLRRLVTLTRPLGGGLPVDREVRKDRALPVNKYQRVLEFHQEYIDNWDSGEVTKRGTKAATTAQWQGDVQRGYEQWGVPRAADKSTHGAMGQTLGAIIDGDRGWIGVSTDRALELAEANLYLLRQPVSGRKDLAMVAGRWGFASQFR